MPSLLLHAVDPHWSPANPDQLTDALGRIGLTGRRREACEGDAFLAGDAFLSLIMFLGCSPKVELDPDNAPAAGPASYVQLHNFTEPRFLYAEKFAKPRCSLCRAPLDGAPALAPEEIYRCPACDGRVEVHALDWRRAAGFGRVFIEIHGIYPQEALPSDKLLETLQSHAGCRWEYFYL